MKKSIYLLGLIICVCFRLQAQITYEYAYDNAGNRILRHLVEVRHVQTPGHSDSVATPVEAALGEMQINVMPNPTTGDLQIAISKLPQEAQGGITVWDLQSKEICRQEGIYATNRIDLSKQPKGVYLMQIRVGSKKSEWRIVKE